MSSRARSPEELEELLEDAFVIRDAGAVSAVFAEGAVLVPGHGRHEARGSDEIARLAEALCDDDQTYFAAPRRVVQARDTALVVASGAVNVVRRADDGGWRYLIALLCADDTTTREEPR